MEIKANSFSLRGESGLVKIVSDSAFDPSLAGPPYSEQAECDVIVESNGFRVNKVLLLAMPRILSFLRAVRAIASGPGVARFETEDGGLSLAFISEAGSRRVECSMNDRGEGKENSVRVKYPIERDYFEDLARQLAIFDVVAERE